MVEWRKVMEEKGHSDGVCALGRDTPCEIDESAFSNISYNPLQAVLAKQSTFLFVGFTNPIILSSANPR
jgi:hypothetical protein